MKLPVNKLEAGMEVAKDVVQDDVILLAAGARLTPQTLRALGVWDIQFVHVAEPKSDQAPTDNNADSRGTTRGGPVHLEKAAQSYIDHRFRHVPMERPAVTRIRDIAAQRVLARLSQQSKPGSGGRL